jgi:hypothetical protein
MVLIPLMPLPPFPRPPIARNPLVQITVDIEIQTTLKFAEMMVETLNGSAVREKVFK